MHIISLLEFVAQCNVFLWNILLKSTKDKENRHYKYTKYTIYLEKEQKDISNTVLRLEKYKVDRHKHIDVKHSTSAERSSSASISSNMQIRHHTEHSYMNKNIVTKYKVYKLLNNM